MREIKFKAWDGRAMFYPTQITFPGGGTWSVEKGRGISIQNQPHITLMQYTGLKDKNGKEIYEGDIVRCFDGEDECDVGEVKFGKFVSSHEAGYSKHKKHQGFFVVQKNGEQVWDNVGEDIEWEETRVIGNIYENPEQLNA